MAMAAWAWYWPHDVTFEKPAQKADRITKQFEEFMSQMVFDQCAADDARLEADILRAIELQGWQRFKLLIIVEDVHGYRSVASLLTSILV